MFKYLKCMIAYNRYKMEVGPHPDRTGWSRKYRYSVGACNAKVHKATKDQLLITMLLEFNHAVVRDQVPHDIAHRAFMQIEEYRAMMAGDVPGLTEDERSERSIF